VHKLVTTGNAFIDARLNYENYLWPLYLVIRCNWFDAVSTGKEDWINWRPVYFGGYGFVSFSTQHKTHSNNALTPLHDTWISEGGVGMIIRDAGTFVSETLHFRSDR